ncbi:MAG TPA: DUF2889 domain-containing protein [Clostridia bacterium]
MNKVTGRNFKIDYFEKEGDIWVVDSHLTDDVHDIDIVLEIDMAQMIITDAKIKFNKFPMEQCVLIEEKAKELKGIKIDNDFTRNAMKIFMGPRGCPNILILLQTSVPGIIYFYYPHKLKTGKMKHEEWDNMIRTELKNACLAHTLL